ncbi:MAG: TIGR00159 family protein [Acidobacteria bacterium]|nr:TIGR00159 family protein [Acidobacteriota bacterium]
MLQILQQFTWRDALDIGAVALIIYGILKLIKDTRAMQMVLGLLVLGLIYFLSSRYDLQTLEFVLRNAMLYVGIAVVVIFQSEIRSALVHFGKYLPRPFGPRELRRSEVEEMIEEIVLAATSLAPQKIGALIVFERNVGLQNFIDSGVRLNADISYDLLMSLFHPRAPLHDGAVIVRGRRLVAASCFLPLTLNPLLSKELGTRHRAALGITEDTDAVALVVSEETGIISLVEGGRINRRVDALRLRAQLNEWLRPVPGFRAPDPVSARTGGAHRAAMPAPAVRKADAGN